MPYLKHCIALIPFLILGLEYSLAQSNGPIKIYNDEIELIPIERQNQNIQYIYPHAIDSQLGSLITKCICDDCSNHKAASEALRFSEKHKRKLLRMSVVYKCVTICDQQYLIASLTILGQRYFDDQGRHWKDDGFFWVPERSHLEPTYLPASYGLEQYIVTPSMDILPFSRKTLLHFMITCHGTANKEAILNEILTSFAKADLSDDAVILESPADAETKYSRFCHPIIVLEGQWLTATLYVTSQALLYKYNIKINLENGEVQLATRRHISVSH